MRQIDGCKAHKSFFNSKMEFLVKHLYSFIHLFQTNAIDLLDLQLNVIKLRKLLNKNKFLRM